MQILKWPFLMLWRAVTLGASVSQIRAVADRVNRHGDRFRNANDMPHARIADEYASRIRNCFTESSALALEEDFLVAVGLKQRSLGAVVRDSESDPWNSGSSGTPSSYGGTSDRSSGDIGAGSLGTPSFDPSGPSSSDVSFTGGGGESGGGGASGSWDTDGSGSGTAAESITDNS